MNILFRIGLAGFTLILTSHPSTSFAENYPNKIKKLKPRPLTSNTTAPSMSARVEKLERQVAGLNKSIDKLKLHSRFLIMNSVLMAKDRLYLRAGLALVLPRASQFNFQTDSGLGAFAGVGRYLGRHHAIQATLEWDVYLAASLVYRYVFTTNFYSFRFGPLLGIKQKIGNVTPFDNFLQSSVLVRKTFIQAGGFAGFQVSGSSLLQTEFNLTFNGQAFFFVNAGLHLFL